MGGALRALVGPETGYLLVPVTSEHDALANRLDGISAPAAPVNIRAYKDTPDGSLLLESIV